MLPESTVLIVDDETSVRQAWAQRLRAQGHVVREALVCHTKGRGPSRLMMFTGSGAIASVVQANQGWQCRFTTMPWDANDPLDDAPTPPEGIGTAAPTSPDLVAVSPAMCRLVTLVGRVAIVDSTVLITGESGVGKEVIARLLVEKSQRRRRPFVAVNCAAIPDPLIESELFGYRKGAFTGAADDRKGLIEAADGGVLFLDEIGEMPLATQSRLLRFLDSREVRRVGDTAARVVDVRIVAATNRLLETEVQAGRFRLDLFYRLNVVQLQVPSLRDRVSDIVPLAHHCLRQCASRLGKPIPVLGAQAAEVLEGYEWPGNVRELQNVIERAMICSYGETITADDIAAALDGSALRCDRPDELSGVDLRQAIGRAGGKLQDAAAALGISRTTLWRRLKAQRRALAEGSSRRVDDALGPRVMVPRRAL